MLLLPALLICQWTSLPSPVKASLRGLSSPSPRVVWASGTKSTVIRSMDGGATWTYANVPNTDLDFRDIQAFDAQTAVAMSAGPGAKSTLYHTRDGGASWTLAHQNTQEKGFFDGIAFWDKRRGILAGDPVDGRFTILATTDGGASWKPLPGPPATEGEGAFAASGSSIAVQPGGLAWIGTGGEKGGRIFRSRDFGATWTAAETPIRHDSASSGIFSVAFRDARNGLAVGGDYRKTAEATGTMIRTTDGGRTWTPVEGLRGFRSAVLFDGRQVIATGPEGSDVSNDLGATWRAVEGQGFHALSGRFASGADGRIASRLK